LTTENILLLKVRKILTKTTAKNMKTEEQKPTVPEASFFQSACYICGSKDHKQPDCKDPPCKNNQQEWYIHKLMDKDQNKKNNSNHFQTDQVPDNADNWNSFGMMYSFIQHEKGT
jgi:hypothetical protein